MAPKKELTNFQRAIAIITVASLLVYSVINLALVINAYARLEGNVNEFADIITNWQAGSITDIQIAASCPGGYETALQDRTWSGTQQGCYCGDVSQSTLDFKNITCAPFCTGACSADARSVNCKEVPAIAPKTLNFWGAVSSTGRQICVKRSVDSFANSAVRSSSDSCPSGYKPCSTADKDTLFCTKETTCPITSISVTSGSSCGLNPDCAVISNDGAGRLLTWTRDNNRLPLAEFKVDEYGICKEKSEDNITPGRSQHYLLNKKLTTCNNEGALKWNPSPASLDEYNLFQYNGIDVSSLKTITSNRYGYYASSVTTTTGYNWYLFNRNYVPFKSSCRNRMESLINKKTLVDDMKSAQLALLIIGIIASFFLGVPLAIMEIQNLRGVDLSCIDGKGEEERTKLKRFKKFVNYFFKGLQVPFQLWAIIVAGSAKGLFIDISDEECSNADTNSILSYLSTTITKTYSSTITALAILVATLLLDFILEAWEKRKTKKDQANNVSPASITNREEKLELAHVEDNTSSSPLKPQPIKTQTQPQPQPQAQPQAQPQSNANSPNIVIQIQQPPNMGYPPQQQYPPQQYPPQQYPPQQYPPQQYPPQQYPPQQYPPQQYPPQQYPPQQYPPQQYPPQQQYPPRY